MLHTKRTLDLLSRRKECILAVFARVFDLAQGDLRMMFSLVRVSQL
jgi:hypothetical protein